MKLSDVYPREQIILGIAETVRNRYPSVKGKCEPMTSELVKELRARGIVGFHAVGYFILDEPQAIKFAGPRVLKKPQDDYQVEHDWVEVEGKILDISVSQFQPYVEEKIPDIAYIDYTDPLYTKYQSIRYV